MWLTPQNSTEPSGKDMVFVVAWSPITTSKLPAALQGRGTVAK